MIVLSQVKYAWHFFSTFFAHKLGVKTYFLHFVLKGKQRYKRYIRYAQKAGNVEISMKKPLTIEISGLEWSG